MFCGEMGSNFGCSAPVWNEGLGCCFCTLLQMKPHWGPSLCVTSQDHLFGWVSFQAWCVLARFSPPKSPSKLNTLLISTSCPKQLCSCCRLLESCHPKKRWTFSGRQSDSIHAEEIALGSLGLGAAL